MLGSLSMVMYVCSLSGRMVPPLRLTQTAAHHELLPALRHVRIGYDVADVCSMDKLQVTILCFSDLTFRDWLQTIFKFCAIPMF